MIIAAVELRLCEPMLLLLQPFSIQILLLRPTPSVSPHAFVLQAWTEPFPWLGGFVLLIRIASRRGSVDVAPFDFLPSQLTDAQIVRR